MEAQRTYQIVGGRPDGDGSQTWFIVNIKTQLEADGPFTSMGDAQTCCNLWNQDPVEAEIQAGRRRGHEPDWLLDYRRTQRP